MAKRPSTGKFKTQLAGAKTKNPAFARSGKGGGGGGGAGGGGNGR